MNKYIANSFPIPVLASTDFDDIDRMAFSCSLQLWWKLCRTLQLWIQIVFFSWKTDPVLAWYDNNYAVITHITC